MDYTVDGEVRWGELRVFPTRMVNGLGGGGGIRGDICLSGTVGIKMAFVSRKKGKQGRSSVGWRGEEGEEGTRPGRTSQFAVSIGCTRMVSMKVGPRKMEDGVSISTKRLNEDYGRQGAN